MADAAPLVRHVTVGAFQENCYLVADPATGECVAVDPGDEGGRILAEVERRGWRLRAIWLTHAHVDHVGAVAALRGAWEAPIHLHPDDRPVYAHAPVIAPMFGMSFGPLPEPEVALAEGTTVQVGALRFDVWHLPGHAPGHVAFIRPDLILSGDLLFQGSIGRTDLPGSDGEAMQRSLARLMTLGDDVVVHPGHGPATRIGAERATNPFLTGIARPVRR